MPSSISKARAHFLDCSRPTKGPDMFYYAESYHGGPKKDTGRPWIHAGDSKRRRWEFQDPSPKIVLRVLPERVINPTRISDWPTERTNRRKPNSEGKSSSLFFSFRSQHVELLRCDPPISDLRSVIPIQSLTMYQWRKFEFFEEKLAGKGAIPDEVAGKIQCCSSGRGKVVTGSDDGTVSFLDRGLHFNYAFRAHSLSVHFLQQLKVLANFSSIP